MLVRQRRRETSRLLLPVVLAALGACLVPPPPPCGPSNCEGCCAGTTCMAGLVDTQCGREGAACGACASGTTCAAGVCQAGGTGGGAGGSAAGGSSAGGSAAGGPGDGGSPYALFLRAAAEAACQHLDCDLSIPAGVRAAECPTVISEGFAVNVLSPVRSVDLGYRTFDPDAGARCLAAIRTAPCGHSFPPLDCYLVTRAVAPTGGACDTNKDCANGLDGCHGPACSRRCGPGGGLNEPCRGTTCDHGLRCAMGRCEPELDAGAPCSDSCGRDLVCVSSVCAPAPGPGSPCLRGRCNGVAYCSVTNQCLARKPLAQACSFDGECVEGLVCVRAACAPPVGRGGACRSTSECAPGLACDDITNSCEPMQRVDSNGSCSSTRLCPGFEECFGQVRVFDGGVGQLAAVGARGRETRARARTACSATEAPAPSPTRGRRAFGRSSVRRGSSAGPAAAARRRLPSRVRGTSSVCPPRPASRGSAGAFRRWVSRATPAARDRRSARAVSACWGGTPASCAC